MNEVVQEPSLFDAQEMPVPAVAKRPARGERRTQILQALAEMLQEPAADRITTASLAAKVGVSEAALYRHFASKAQMFDALIEFIETTVDGLIERIVPPASELLTESGATPSAESVAQASAQALRIVEVLVQFGERNPGLARVMVGDALVHENARLQARMNRFFDRVESSLRQCMRVVALGQGAGAPTVIARADAAALLALAIGVLQRFVRTGFQPLPAGQFDAMLMRWR